MLVAIPMQVFCFPVVPESSWTQTTFDVLWDGPQYTTGHKDLQKSTDSVTFGVCGTSMGHYIIISGLFDPFYDNTRCQIWDKGGRRESTTDIERYPYGYKKYCKEVIVCNFQEKGRLIVETHLNSKGKILAASCCWQTLEMMEASLK